MQSPPITFILQDVAECVQNYILSKGQYGQYGLLISGGFRNCCNKRYRYLLKLCSPLNVIPIL